MTKPTDDWMPFYVSDYVRDTSRLTTCEHGAYVLLILDYWVNGPPPDDDRALAAITKSSPKVWKMLRQKLQVFFSQREGEWRHKRIDAELDRARGKVEQTRAAGRASAAARWAKTDNGAVTDVITPVVTGGVTNGQREDQRNGNGAGNETMHLGPSTEYQERKEPLGEALESNLDNKQPLTRRSAHEHAREAEPLTEAVGEPFDDGESEESFSFQKLVPVARAARSAPNGASKVKVKKQKRDLLISKVTRFATDTFPQPEALVAITGLLGGDPEHSDQWWLDHLDKLMRTQRWDDTRMSA